MDLAGKVRSHCYTTQQHFLRNRNFVISLLKSTTNVAYKAFEINQIKKHKLSADKMMMMKEQSYIIFSFPLF